MPDDATEGVAKLNEFQVIEHLYKFYQVWHINMHQQILVK